MNDFIKEFKIKFRGIRGSHPVCAENKLGFGGNTSCVELNINGHVIILDAGTGIIESGNELIKSYIASGTSVKDRTPIQALILFSHYHMDHLQGLPFFKPLYITGSKIKLYGAKFLGQDFKTLLSNMIFKLMFPVDLEDIPASLSVNNLKETEAIVLYPGIFEPEVITYTFEEEISIPENAVVITCMRSYSHPKEGVKIFKIKCNGKTLIYATDKESYIGGDIKMVNFTRGADILIHDAQYTTEDYLSPIATKQGYGHSTVEMAIETAKQANVPRLILFHLDPAYDDNLLKKIQEKAQGQFPKSVIAYENMEIDLLLEKCKV